MNEVNPIILVLLLATIAEAVIEAVKPGLDPAFDWLLRVTRAPENVEPYFYLSVALGVATSLAYGADLVEAVGIAPPSAAVGTAAQVATGILIGRGANFVHNVITRVADRKSGTLIEGQTLNVSGASFGSETDHHS